MTLTTKQRRAVFALVVAFIAGAVGWALRNAWTTLHDVERLDAVFKLEVGQDVKTLAGIQQQFAGIAGYVTKAMNDLNNSLLAFVLRDDQRELANYQEKSQALRDWIRQQEPSVIQMELILNTQPTFRANVRKTVQDIDQAYERYLASAQELTGPITASPAGQAERLKQFATVQENYRQVLVLANQAFAQSEAMKLSGYFSKEWFPAIHKMTSKWIPILHRRLIVASVVSVLGLCAALSVLVYHLWVSPLRTKLVESDSIIQRQEKFAHLGQLAAVVAHEIKNPLTAINARLYTLQRALAEGSNEHADATVIRTEIQRLDQIVKDFLRLDRPNGGQRARLAAEPLLREIQSLFASHLQGQSITLTVESATECQLLGDEQQLKQVLINLVQNAADSIQQDGTITLRARDSTARLKGQDSEVVILEVEDTGPGIAPEVQEKLFHPFFTTKVDGTGLGLPISARIIDRLGGKIDFQTRLHHGTTFRIILPAADRKS